MNDPTVTVNIPDGRRYTVWAWELDAAIAKYLPQSPSNLRELVENVTSDRGCFDNVNDACSLLVILAYFEDRADLLEWPSAQVLAEFLDR